MIPRGQLDIPFSKLFIGIVYCITTLFQRTKQVLFPNHQIACLSVRTGFTLALQALKLPSGSEILVSDINIADMFSIINAHNLIAVPLPLNRHTLGIDVAQMELAITPNTKAILITHLFGAVMEIDAVIASAKKHQLIVIEDCAQAYNGTYAGHCQSDLAMFSFGMIKTNTTLTGAILNVNNTSLCHKMKQLNETLPVQASSKYFKKLLIVTVINIVTRPKLFALLYKWCDFKKIDIDDLLSGFIKGFPGEDLMTKISYQPCYANLKLLQNRFNNYCIPRLEKRKKIASQILHEVNDAIAIGSLNQNHSHWVVPIKTQNADEVIGELRSQGFDVTTKASSLVQLYGGNLTNNKTDLKLTDFVYLPNYLKMNTEKVGELNNLVKQLNN